MTQALFQRAIGAAVGPSAEPAVRTDRVSLAIAMFLGTFATLSIGTAPISMGALVDAGRLTMGSIGGVATSELLALALGGALGPMFLARGSMRGKLVLIAILLLVANVATYGASLPYSIYLVRMAAGFFEGLFAAALMLMIVASRDPERSQAIYLAASTVPQVVINYLLAVFLIPAFGPVSGFGVMALFALIGIFLAMRMPKVAPHRQRSAATHGDAWSLATLLLCSVVLINNGAIGCVWYYLERLATMAGATRNEVGLSVSIFLGAQFFGASSAALKHSPYTGRYAILALTSILAVLSIVFLFARSGPPLLLVSALFGFFQIIITPCCVRMMIWFDPEGRAVPQLTPLTLIGLSGGSLLASRAVSHDDVSGSFVLGAVLMLVAGAASVVALAVHSRSMRAAHGTLG